MGHKEYLEISALKVAVTTFILLTLIMFSFGWECGFAGDCPTGKGDCFIGVFRVLISVIWAVVLVIYTMYCIVEGRTLRFKNPFYDKDAADAQEEYRQWLRDRKKEI